MIQSFLPIHIKLTRPLLLLAAFGMVCMWIAFAFWGVIFIVKGMFDFYATEIFSALLYTTTGVSLLLQIRSRILVMQKRGLVHMVKTFFETRFVEVIATVVFMIGIAFIVGNNVEFIANWLLLFPISLGTTFGFSLGQFMETTLHIPFSAFLIITASWLLELFWLYLFSWLFIRILLRFQLISSID